MKPRVKDVSTVCVWCENVASVFGDQERVGWLGVSTQPGLLVH